MRAGLKIKKPSNADLGKILLSAVFIGMVFIPLIRMFTFMDAKTVCSVVTSATFLPALRNSLATAVVSTGITLTISFILAICIHRTKIQLKGVFGILFTLPMLIPSISNGMGLVILFGNNGILTRFLNLSDGIYGFWGIVTGSVLYSFPVAYLMLSDVFRYEDGSPYEAAQVLGIPKYRQFFAITLPYLRKPLISVIFAVFAMIITDYGVPLMIGGKYTTIASIMYQEVIGQLDFGKGAVYGTFLLIPAVAAFVIDMVNQDKSNTSYVTTPCRLHEGTGVKILSYICCVLAAVFTLLPIAAFLLLSLARNYPYDLSFTLDNLQKALKLRAGVYLGNSVIIALGTAVAGTAIAFVTAYISARVKSGTSRFLHLSSMTSAAIPGVVLGLSYVLTFNRTPLYGTIIILIMVNVVHFIASPYLMMYNSFSKINENLESVAQTMGIRRLYVIRDVFIPQCTATLIEMFAYFFVNCMMTISAVSFLAGSFNKPVSLMINQFEAQMQLECAAVVSLMILCVNLLIKALSAGLGRCKFLKR